MKDMFLKFCRMLLGILGVSAVSACGEGILPAPEYVNSNYILQNREKLPQNGSGVISLRDEPELKLH